MRTICFVIRKMILKVSQTGFIQFENKITVWHSSTSRLQVYPTSASFLAEISVSSPRKLFIFII